MPSADDVIRGLPSVLRRAAVACSVQLAAEMAQPGLGGVVVGTFLSALHGRKVERCCRFVEVLAERLNSHGKEPPIDLAADPDGPIRLFEHGWHAAAEAPTINRAEQIAHLVANSLSSGGIDVLADEHLLRVLGELGNLEILILVGLGLSPVEQDAHWRKHRASLAVPLVTRFSEREDRKRAAVFESCQSRLVRLGLVDAETLRLEDLGRSLLNGIRQSWALGDDIALRYSMERRQAALAQSAEPGFRRELFDAVGTRATNWLAGLRLQPEVRVEANGRVMHVAVPHGDRLRNHLLIIAHGAQFSGTYSYQAKDKQAADELRRRHRRGERTLAMPRDKIGTTRFVNVRADAEGAFATVGHRRVYEVEQVADYLLEPLADRRSPSVRSPV